MKVIIAGGRDFTDHTVLSLTLKQLYGDPPSISHVVCGMAVGADQLGLEWATAHHIPVKRCWPKTYQYGPFTAFKRRNWEMAYVGDELLAFWDGVSGGTRHMIHAMNSLHKPVWIRMYTPTSQIPDLDTPPHTDIGHSTNLFSITDQYDE